MPVRAVFVGLASSKWLRMANCQCIIVQIARSIRGEIGFNSILLQHVQVAKIG